jgi:hypothetical protein
MVDTEVLSQLSKLAKQLNADSDSVNAAIATFDKQLSEMNLGIEAWVQIDDSGIKLDSDSGSPERKYRELTLLGFRKLEDRWQLVINDQTVTYLWDVDEKEEYPATEDCYRALRKASRDTRLAAIDYFDDLLDVLQIEATHKLAKLERAKKLAAPAKKGGK